MPTGTYSSQAILKTGQAIVRAINVCVAGSAAGTLNDAATTGAAASSNAVAGTPAVAGDCSPPAGYPIICAQGLVVTPGSGQTIWLNWE